MTKRFFAVQLKDRETTLQGVKRFYDAANSIGVKFHTLEIFRDLSLGTRRFVRFRTDAQPLERIADGIDTRCIVPNDRGSYAIKGDSRTLAATVMQESVSVGKPLKLVGTRSEFWERQFGKL